MPRLPPIFGITCDLCGRRFGTLLSEIDVRGLTMKAICEACTDAITHRDGKLPGSLGEWNEAIKKSVPKPRRKNR